MADDAKNEQEAKPSNGGVFKVAILLAVVTAAAGGGFATYKLLLEPMLSSGEEMARDGDLEDRIPLQPIMVELPENYVNVIMEDRKLPASTLLYAVTFECKNQLTADLIAAHMPRFVDMIGKLHDSRLRSELDDLQNLKASMQREARQKANALLVRIERKPSDDVEVTNVFHRTLMVDDKL